LSNLEQFFYNTLICNRKKIIFAAFFKKTKVKNLKFIEL